jgi:hypothetical protein
MRAVEKSPIVQPGWRRGTAGSRGFQNVGELFKRNHSNVSHSRDSYSVKTPVWIGSPGLRVRPAWFYREPGKFVG